MTLKFRETHHHQKRKRRRNRTSFGKRRNRGGEEERHGNELEVFPTGKWQRWQGEKIMPRSEFMSRRQTNSSHVSPSENTRLGRARAPIYTCTPNVISLSLLPVSSDLQGNCISNQCYFPNLSSPRSSSSSPLPLPSFHSLFCRGYL